MSLDEQDKLIIEEWAKENKVGIKYTDFGFTIIPHCKRKGKYVKEFTPLDSDLAVVNKAVYEYLVNRIDPKITIYDCDSYVDFQKVFKKGNTYKGVWHNGKYTEGKVFRVFASKSIKDTYLGKYKENCKTIEKFADCPEHCFIDNGDVNNKDIPDNLDREWYVKLAKERLKQYGFDLDAKIGSLF